MESEKTKMLLKVDLYMKTKCFCLDSDWELKVSE